MLSANKVTSEHLRRAAYLYVRQSSLQQVQDHRESTARQYALKGRAQVLGWASEQIVVIDEDQGLSGAAAVVRTGFQRLVAEVGLGHVGLVMGLEVSRLARNSADWHRLLEICALAETLILDEDGLYDPSQFNDRLLLGLKGTMSEAELHVLRARLLGGTLNKARRGELWMRPPIGLVYDRAQGLMLEPDAQIQGAVRLLFATFRRTGSAEQVVRHFAREGVRWPRRLTTGPRAGEVGWGRLEHSRVLDILHNPRYAGAFVYGRRRQRKVRRHRPAAVSASAAGRVEGVPAQRASGLPQLGGVRDQSGHAPGECSEPRAGSPAESRPRGRGAYCRAWCSVAAAGSG